MRGSEQGPVSGPEKPRKRVEGLDIPPGVKIFGLAAIGAAIAGVAANEARKRIKQASEGKHPPEAKKE